jgi:hypothetical protein
MLEGRLHHRVEWIRVDDVPALLQELGVLE